ncbi:MAG TPA: DNA-3-methyladenine glycosylase I [Fibrobacteria bacterium]|nr:DNA-3-methyladenine glycosylase I [Fibrobacteria bacterium]
MRSSSIRALPRRPSGSLRLSAAVKPRGKPAPVRCPWVDLDKPDYVAYHDKEWGVPVHDDRLLFEFLTLEAAQAGLSWYTVLRKRENYRAAFDGFDPVKVARYDARKIGKLLADPGIIRNRAKILAAVNNAKRFLEVQKEFGSFDAYVWGFVGGKPIVNKLRDRGDYRAASPESDALSADLRKRGFKFVGTTICYAHMQATGMVNDHILACRRHREVQGRPARKKAVRNDA